MAQRKSETRGGPSKKKGAGCLVWLVMMLVTLLLFVVNWDVIKETLESTGFIEAVGKSGDAQGQGDGPTSGDDQPRGDDQTRGDGSLEPTASPEAPRVVSPSPAGDATAKPTGGEPSDTRSTGRPEAAPSTGRPSTEAPATKPIISPMEQVKATRVAVLYFIRVDDDGAISRHEAKRTVGASDSPMTDALEALMAGPSADELGRGLISLIPSEARLLSAQVRGSTAYLNFNEAFMYNRYGIEGYAGQLKQIVYTATNFSTVKDVQILIEGQPRDYLGGDGVYIGKPLSRASF